MGRGRRRRVTHGNLLAIKSQPLLDGLGQRAIAALGGQAAGLLGGLDRIGKAAGLGIGRGQRIQSTGSPPPESRTARRASSTAWAPSRSEGSGEVANSQAIAPGRRASRG